MIDLVIIGGGPAALAAALYALGKQIDVRLVYDDPGGRTGAHQRLVGQLADEYVAGEDAVQLFERRVSEAGCAFQDHVAQVQKRGEGFRVVTERHGDLDTRAVLVATGATPRTLDVPGADEFLGQGLGYSATTHTQLLAGKTAAVIGATDRALRGVAELAQTAARVYLITPEPLSFDEPLARAICRLPHVELLEDYRVVEVCGGFNVEELIVAHNGETRRLAVDAAFIDLGLLANSDCVRSLVATDDHGFIQIDRHNATSVHGIFAAGDVTSAFGEQKLIAIGDGARAALSAYDYLLALTAMARR